MAINKSKYGCAALYDVVLSTAWIGCGNPAERVDWHYVLFLSYCQSIYKVGNIAQNLNYKKMKKLFSLLFLVSALIFTSCGSKVYPIQGNYNNENSTKTDAEFEKVWDNVIDYFAKNNIPIATLEKSSGLIVATAVAIDSSLVTMEDKKGILINQNAWFVMPYYDKCVGGDAECSFNVRVRKQEDGKTYIGINIGNIQGWRYVKYFDGVTLRNQVSRWKESQCISTGNFEKHLLELFKE